MEREKERKRDRETERKKERKKERESEKIPVHSTGGYKVDKEPLA